MRRVLDRAASDEGGAEDRTRRVVAILAIGIERLLEGQRQAAGSGVDLPPDVSVTTDCQSNGHVEEQ